MESLEREDRNLLLFFLIAFGFTWLFWIPEALAMRGFLGSSIIVDFLLSPNNPAALGPFVSAFLLTWWNERGRGVIRLLKRGVDYGFPRVWWVPTIFIFPLICGGALLLVILGGERIPDLMWASNPSLIVTFFFSVLLFQGPLQEEFGWRGYALGRLQTRFNAINSSIILGLVWGAWHLPYFWIGEEVVYTYTFLPQVFSTILVSILFTWLYNNTAGSILVALVFHTMLNYSMQMFPALETEVGALFYLVFSIATVVAVLAIWGPRRMVRGEKRKR